jgi:hypothetical protein
VWRTATPLTGFVQRELREGEPVTERTEVRIASDGLALYIGAWLLDKDPAGIVSGEKIRDVSLDNSDYVAIILDTYLDRQNGFVFATTPAGVEYDGQVAKEGEGGGITVTGQTRAQSGSMGGFNLNWDGSWTVRTSRDEAGWYAEFRIPFSTLRYGSGSKQSWGLNVARGIRRKGEGRVLVAHPATVQSLSAIARGNAGEHRRTHTATRDHHTIRPRWIASRLRGGRAPPQYE